MGRTRQLNLTLSEEEYQAFFSAKPINMSMPAVVRSLAWSQLQWLATRGLKHDPVGDKARVNSRVGSTSAQQPTQHVPGELTLDTSDSQVR